MSSTDKFTKHSTIVYTSNIKCEAESFYIEAPFLPWIQFLQELLCDRLIGHAKCKPEYWLKLPGPPRF